MKNEFIPYEQALALKELGFDEPCLGLYHNDKTLYTTECKLQEQFHGQICSAPLYQQAFRFFRDKGFYSAIMPKITPSNTIVYYIYEGKPKKDWNNCFETYEKAELACINKLIKICKEFINQ